MRPWEFVINSNVEYKGQIVWVMGFSGDEDYLMLQDLQRSGAEFKVYMNDPLLKAIEIYPELFVSMGFEKMESHSWCGNGQDYQLPPQEGGSRTTYDDYVKSGIRGDRDLIIRFESYEFGKDTFHHSTVQLFIEKGYPGGDFFGINVTGWMLHRLQNLSQTLFEQNHFTIKL